MNEVFNKLTGAITGETEGLKRIGILVNETIIKRMALTDETIKQRLATEKTTKEYKQFGNRLIEVNTSAKKQSLVLTDVEKVMLRYKAIIQRTDKDQGDMKRTIDDTTNVFRVIAAQVKVTGNTIGNVFIKDVTKAGTAVRDFLKNNQDQFREWS